MKLRVHSHPGCTDGQWSLESLLIPLCATEGRVPVQRSSRSGLQQQDQVCREVEPRPRALFQTLMLLAPARGSPPLLGQGTKPCWGMHAGVSSLGQGRRGHMTLLCPSPLSHGVPIIVGGQRPTWGAQGSPIWIRSQPGDSKGCTRPGRQAGWRRRLSTPRVATRLASPPSACGPYRASVCAVTRRLFWGG